MLDTIMRDLRYALRQLVKNPGFAAVAVLTLAIGIGAGTAIFSVVDGVLLRPLPYPDAERLVRVWHQNTRNFAPREQIAYETFQELTEGVGAFDAAAGISPHWTFAHRGAGVPERAQGYWVSASFFDLLDVRPLLGRGFMPDEDRPGGERVVVISHVLWQGALGGTPDVVGQALDVEGAPATVIGVMPPDFRFGEPSDLWFPLAQNPIVPRGRQVRWVDVVARLAPGATLDGASRETEAFMARLADDHPAENAGLEATVESLYSATVGSVRTALWSLLAAAILVLLVACANTGNLLLARASARGGEMAVRRAVGASRGQLVRQLLTESVLLGLIGGGLGILLAFWLLDFMRVAGPSDLPRLHEVVIDLRVLGVVLLASLGAGVACGIAPAFAAAREGAGASIRERSASGTGGRMGSGFVVSEVAIALVLLVGSGLLLKSFVTLLNVDAGFEAEGVLTLQFGVPDDLGSGPTPAFYDRLFEELEEIPGVTAAGGVTRLPLGSQLSTRLQIRGGPVADEDQPDVEFRRASGGYFAAMRIPIVAGRTFDRTDDLDAPPVVVLSAAAARQLWPGEDPIGRQVRFWFAGITPDAPWSEVVGVAGDVRHFGLHVAAPPVVYVPFSQGPPSSPLLAIRTIGNPLDIAGVVQDRIRALHPNIVIWDLEPMTARVASSVASRRFNLMLVGLFGSIALLLAAVGIYGVMAQAVRRRMREIGIRMALGATGPDVVRMIVGRGLLLTSIGLGFGLVASLALMRLVRALLFGVDANDPVTFAAATTLLAAAAIIASWLPSLRAARMNPVDALRPE